jgi:hypothetical protein
MERKTNLLFSNVPVECTGEYLKQWIEARGYDAFRVHLIQDVISGTSPSFAYVELMDLSKLNEAARTLHGQILLGRSGRVCHVVPLHTAVTSERSLRASA